MNAVAAKKESVKKTAPKKTATKKDNVKGKVSNSALYDVISRPVVTEKSTMGSEHNKVTFKVRTDATKPLIKQAVEEIFGVTVVNVNTVSIKGKTKRFRGLPGQRSDIKKAVVTLAQGQTIDLTAGVR
ncbi:MAG: 50S ribosomal protein L23 [Rickettsiales bacterium]|nr:50S ribosomal protein L23 [Rickettsiales bacterium]